MEAVLAHDDNVAMFLVVIYSLACLPHVCPVGFYNAARFSGVDKYSGYDITLLPQETFFHR